MLADPSVFESNFALSPDGRWLAYTSNESGGTAVFVRPFPDVEGGKWPVSRVPATSPRWSPDGGELFYKTRDNRLMAAEIIVGTTFIIGERTELFSVSRMLAETNHAQYDVHPDGDRFLMIQLDPSGENISLVVVEGFFQELGVGAGN